MKKSEKVLKYFIGILFLLLYMLVATISAICSIDFFVLSHSMTMSICLAIAFELGAMCSLCAGVFMKSNRTLSFSLFILLTAFQMMGNVFHSYTNLTEGFVNWIELFGLTDLELIAQKRIVAIVSGAILPIVALGFIKCFVDYNDKDDIIEKTEEKQQEIKNPNIKKQIENVENAEAEEPENIVETISEEKQPQQEPVKANPIQAVENPEKFINKKVEDAPKHSVLNNLFNKQTHKDKTGAVDLDPSTLI